MSDPLPPFDLAQALDRCAKCWWGASLVLKCLGFAAGACIALLPAEPVPFIVAACTILAELAMYRSDAVKATAQLLRRKLDLQDSFGWPIPKIPTWIWKLRQEELNQTWKLHRAKPTPPR